MQKKDILLIQYTDTLDHLIHLGAGRCRELEGYLLFNPKHLMLVEADAMFAQALQKRTEENQTINVINKAVSEETGSKKLWRYSLPDVHSLHEATGLYELFPGLKQLEPLMVETINPVELIKPLALQVRQNNLLVIDVPGEELSLLKALQKAKKLSVFRFLELHCGMQALYKDGDSAGEVLDWLKKQGFDILTEDKSNDPDRPRWLLKVNEITLERDELTLLVADQLVQLALLTEEKSSLIQSNQLLSQEKSELIQARDHQISALIAERDEQLALATGQQNQLELLVQEKVGLIQDNQLLTKEKSELFQAKDQQINVLAGERDEQHALLVERQTQLEMLMQEKNALFQIKEQLAQENLEAVQGKDQQISRLLQEQNEQVALTTEQKTELEMLQQEKTILIQSNEQLTQEMIESTRVKGQQINTLTDERDEQSVLVNQSQKQLLEIQEQQTLLVNQHQTLKQTLETILNQEVALKKELEEVKQTTSLSIKLQTLKEADLKDLQHRYQASLVVQENQHKLLKQLSERLTLAADYFHEISAQSDLLKEEKLVSKHVLFPWLSKFKKKTKVDVSSEIDINS